MISGIPRSLHMALVNNSVFTVQALQPISILLAMYKQASTGSKEFQDPCTWPMQNNSAITVQALPPISIAIAVYNQASTGSQVSQDPSGTWFMQSNPLRSMKLPRASERRPWEYCHLNKSCNCVLQWLLTQLAYWTGG